MPTKTVSLKEIHCVEFDLLQKCKTICEKNRIPYYLCYGTLLGATRHQGFIPWDDDIDLMMPVDAIPLFKQHFQEAYQEPYFFSDIDTEKICLEPWPKLRNSSTTSMPRAFRGIDANWGICIDIFPMYPISESFLLQKAKQWAMHMTEVLLRAGTAKADANSSRALRVAAAVPYGMRKAVAKVLMKYLAHGDPNSRLVYVDFSVFNRSSLMDGEVKLPFEKELFSVPARYHEYLTATYGNYMQLPPENERNGHSGALGEIIWDTQNSYRAYQEGLK